MPPKAPPPKKLTKKELKEKMLEEQRLKEEADKLQREEDERKRIERERLRKIEEERLAAEEKARLQEEEVENEVQKSVFRENLENAKKVAKASDDWDKFILCQTKPDIVQEAQLTTFITLFKEQKPVEGMRIYEELEKIQYAENVVRDIYRYIFQLKAERKQGLQQNNDHKNYIYIKNLRSIILKKVEQINTHLIVNSDAMLDERQKEISNQIKEGPGKNPSKIDDKNKLDICKIFPPVDDFKYGISIYSSSKPTQYNFKPNDFKELNIFVDYPRGISMFIQRVFYTTCDYLSNENQYSKDRIIGGIIDVEYLQLLPTAKKVSNWSLKANYDLNEVVKRHQFELANNPIRLQYQLPPYLWLQKKETYRWRPAIFDKQSESWLPIEGVQDEPKYDKGIIQLSINKLGPVALLQERCSDFPYRSFKLRCVANEIAILDIVGKRDTFKFEIGAGYIVLLKQDPEFQAFANKKLQVGHLFYELYRCGVNFMPTEGDAQTSNIVRKDEGAEELAIYDLSEAVRGFYIESSRWNNSDTEAQIVAKIKENPEFDEEFAENQEKDWKQIKWWHNKCAAIQARDSANKCNQQLLPDTETHCSLEVLLKFNQLTTPEIIQKMKDLHYVIFIETIQHVLRLTKILSYTILD